MSIDAVAERKALVERMCQENLASSNAASNTAPQAQVQAPVAALLPAVDPHRAVGAADVQRIARAYSQPEPSVQTPDGLAMLAQAQQQQQQLQLALLQQSQQPMWRQVLPYFVMGLATIGTFMFLRWCFGSSGSSLSSVSSMTPEQQQVMRFAQQNVLSGNDEAMQALAVLARQFKA